MGWPARLAALVFIIVWFGACFTAAHGETDAENEEASLVAGLEPLDGLLPVYQDLDENAVYIALPAPDPKTGISTRLLYYPSLTTGVGLGPIQLDRGVADLARLVEFRVVGTKVLLSAVFADHRADTAPDVKRGGTSSFAHSVIWSGEVEEALEGGALLVNLTSFLLRNALTLNAALPYYDNPERSVVDFDRTLVFENNIEFDTVLTMTGDQAGQSNLVPDLEAVSVVMHHSFLRLPDNGYRPRRMDPRMGVDSLAVRNFGAAPGEPIASRYVKRFRLEKTDPDAARSTVRKPIVFHLERSVPEPYRSAILRGARAWADAFEALGYIDAFRVEMLPEGAHPEDSRYNTIRWVWRIMNDTAYALLIPDPRTGEIVNARVTLSADSFHTELFRLRGFLGRDEVGTGSNRDPQAVALQGEAHVAAHEIGHALGLLHNFAGSSYDGGASVMDYVPLGLAVNDDGRIEVRRTYPQTIGSWDKLNIRYLYTDFGSLEREQDGLAAIAAETARHHFIHFQPIRHPAIFHPGAGVFDQGEDPAAALATALEVRKAALQALGMDNLAPGSNAGDLRQLTSQIYRDHQFQLTAVIAQIGGYSYRYALSDSAPEPLTAVPADRQTRALEAVMASLSPDHLMLPDHLPPLLLPGPVNQIGFNTDQGDGADHSLEHEQDLAAWLVRRTFRVLMDADRLRRLERQVMTGTGTLSAGDLLARIRDEVLEPLPPRLSSREATLRFVLARQYVDALAALEHDGTAGSTVTLVTAREIALLEKRLKRSRAETFEALLARLTAQRRLLREKALRQATGQSQGQTIQIPYRMMKLRCAHH